MEKSVFKTTVFILGAFFGVSSAALATGNSHSSHHQTDPRTWDQVRNLHHANEQAVDARTWDQIRDIHHEAQTAAADERTWYQVRHRHGAAKDGRILADN